MLQMREGDFMFLLEAKNKGLKPLKIWDLLGGSLIDL